MLESPFFYHITGGVVVLLVSAFIIELGCRTVESFLKEDTKINTFIAFSYTGGTIGVLINLYVFVQHWWLL